MTTAMNRLKAAAHAEDAKATNGLKFRIFIEVRGATVSLTLEEFLSPKSE